MTHSIKQIIGRKPHIDNCLDWLAERGWILYAAWWEDTGCYTVDFRFAPRDDGQHIVGEDVTFSEAVNEVIRHVHEGVK